MALFQYRVGRWPSCTGGWSWAIELTEADRDTLKAAAAPECASGLTLEIGGNALQAIPEQGASEAIGILIST